MVVSSACYACKCLNVRISSHSACSPDSQLSTDKEWVCVNVDDDGIAITHSEFTLRTRSKPSPDPKDVSRYFRYMSLTCMSCQSLVYRVLQAASPDPDGKEGPILPTEDWVEKEALKTLTGRVEVHNTCLTREAIVEAESQPSFSITFRIILPVDSELSSAGPSQSPPSDPPETRTHLPPLPPLFLPPPFTPSHPAFLHIASLATAESERIRATAEEYLASVTQEKLRQIEDQETQIRRQTELLWSRFREATDKFEGEKRDISSHKKRDSGKWPIDPPAEFSGNIVAITDFVPAPVAPKRLSVSPSSSTPRASALSASMATSSFHHPRQRSAPEISQRSPSSHSETESQSRGIGVRSSASSPTLVNSINDPEINYILDPFRREMNEAKDIATSLLVLDLEAEMERRLKQRSAQAEARPGPSAQRAVQAGPSIEPLASGTDKEEEAPPADDLSTPAPADPNTNPEGKKGKRKVTFDIKPDAVTPKRDVTTDSNEAVVQDARDTERNEVPVFDLEEESNNDTDPDSSIAQPPASLPLVDPQISQAHRRRQTPRRVSNGVGLPQSLSSLRPGSLPAPFMGQVPIPPQAQEPVLELDGGSQQWSPEAVSEGLEEDLHPGAAELMKLVAADTPSHRGAWRDSKAWKMFMAIQSNGVIGEDSDEFEVNEAVSQDDEHGWNSYEPDTVAHSLPVSIGTPLAQKSLGPPSYQVKTSLADRPEVVVPAFPNRTTSEAHGERDRSRDMDPGPLNFTVSSVVDDQDESDDSLGELVEGRGRQHALRILQARSQLPEPGMWRSLAS